MKNNEINNQIENIYKSKHRQWVNKIIIIKDYGVVKLYDRNN